MSNSLNTENSIKYEYILGTRRISNYIFALVLFTSGLAFFLAGLSSYFKVNFIPFSELTGLFFIPQGMTLLFYGTMGLSISLFILLTILLDVGSGFNAYDKAKGEIIIFRRGFIGSNREIKYIYPLVEIESIKLKSTESFNSIPSIYLSLKDKRQIPLTQSEPDSNIQKIEQRAAELAKFLNLNLDA